MKRLISAATSVCMAASLLTVLPATVSAADSTKTLTIGTYAQSGSEYASQGSNVTISADAIAAGDVKIPCAVYLDEATADCETLAIPITVNSKNSDVKNVKFDLIDPAKPYFNEAKTITTAKGETIKTKNAVVFAAGLDEMGDYAPTGITNLTVDSKQESAGTDNYYIGFGQTFPRGYSWTGAKSDDYPVFVFDVTFPQGTAAGDYTIDFCNYEKDAKKNPALLIEAADSRYANLNDLSNLKLNPMKITVAGGGSQQSDGDIVLDFGTYENVKPGDKVTVEVKLKSGADKAVGSYDVKFKLDSPLSIAAFGATSAAYDNATVESNKDTLQASFISLSNGDPVKGAADENVFKFSVQIPENCAEGVYNVGIDSAEIFKGGKNSDTWSYSVTGGTIKVGNVPGSSTTSTVTSTSTTLPDSDADIILDFGTYDNVKPGDKVTVEVKLMSGADKAVGSYDVKFKLDSPLTIAAFGASSAAYDNAAVESNNNTLQASFISLNNGDPINGTEGENVFKFSVQVPTSITSGKYNIGIASAEIFKGGKNSDTWTYSTVNGVINVTGGDKPMIGDLDKNKKIVAVDASLLLAYVADLTAGKVTPTDEDFYICDVNRDGKLTPVDASIILRYYADVQAGFEGTFVDYLIQVIKVDSSKLQ